jgi:Secretion system C-terminal sorting domain
MRPIICILMLFVLPFPGEAQKVSSQVTNLAGKDLTPVNLVLLTVSVGEPAIATFFNTDFILTQGFLQPEIVPCGEYELTYYPNPTRDDVTILVQGCDSEIEAMQLIDIWGRVITTIKPTSDNKVQLGDISPGVYFIRVFLTNSESETLKIAKVSN